MTHDTSQSAETLIHSGAIDSTDLVVSIKDRHGRYLRVNRGFETLLGLDREQVHGKTDGALNPRDIADRVIANDDAALAVGVPTEVVETLLGRDGRIEVRTCRFALRDEAGQPWAVCCVSAPPDEVASARAERDRLARLEPGIAPEEGAEVLGLSPEAAAELEAKLEHEHARAAALEAELKTVRAGSEELERDLTRTTSELGAAREEIAAASAITATDSAALSLRLARAVASAETVDGAARAAFAELGEGAGWDVAVCWLADPAHSNLRSVSVWCAASLADSTFETDTWRGSIGDGPGAIAQAWREHSSTWIEDLGSEPDCARSRAAVAAGLGTAAVVPISGHGENRGLIELYRRDPLRRDEDALALAGAVGVQLATLARLVELAEKPRWR